ncbi:MAG: stimulus-sensing domain-containing protein [Rhodospirillaceae bacterium]|nr:stimulus-sensing domain-containing protein [Rhodospirillaceae bacterium]
MDAADRTPPEMTTPAPDAAPPARGGEPPSAGRRRQETPEAMPPRKQRRFSRLSVRIMALSIFPVATIFGGLLYVGAYERSLVEAELNALSAQARLFAGALAETAVTPGTPDERRIDMKLAANVMRQLAHATNARARLFDRDGRLLVDTRILRRPYGDVREEDLPTEGTERWFTDNVVALYEWFFNLLARDRESVPYYREHVHETAGDYAEVQSALGGEPRSFIRRTVSGDYVLFFAAPIQRYKNVDGALLLSASAHDIARSVRKVRLDILRIIAVVTVFTIMLSFYLGRSIARPINRLAAAADAMRRSKSRDVAIPDFTEREDEIGDLSAALNDLTNDLWHRLDAIESFAADVSHELKNPLASMKSAIETVTRIQDPEKQKRLLDMVREDVERLDRLITDISRASRLDSEMSRVKLKTVDVGRVLGALADIRNSAAAASPGRPIVRLTLPGRDRLAARADEDRLVQVFQNILVNAESFSPPAGTVTVGAAAESGYVRIWIEDEGPGIPPGKEKDIFKRFYSERPAGEKFGTHSGLGLSISKLIVEAMGGTIHAENIERPDGRIGGARFVVRLQKAG